MLRFKGGVTKFSPGTGQRLTLVHFSPQPAPFLTRNTSPRPLGTPSSTATNTPKTALKQPLNTPSTPPKQPLSNKKHVS